MTWDEEEEIKRRNEYEVAQMKKITIGEIETEENDAENAD